MPKSDDPIEQVRHQYKPESQDIVTGLVKKGLEKLPIAGIAFAYWQSEEQKAKQASFGNTVLDILAAHDVRIEDIEQKIAPENLVHTIAPAVERILWGATDKKIKRFAAVVGDVLMSGKEVQDFEDAASFIRTLDELSEDDLRVLMHLYGYQKTYFNWSIHAGTFSFMSEPVEKPLNEVNKLGIDLETFYARCVRLIGYGLVLQVDRGAGSSNYLHGFRISMLGKRLGDVLSKHLNESAADVKY